MRVLFWSPLYRPYIGGAEVFASQLIAALRARGVEFLVITSHHDRELPDRDSIDGVEVRRLPFRAAIASRDVKAFVRAVSETAAIKREFAPHLIHMNGVGPDALFHLRTRSASAAPLLVTLQQEVLASQAEGTSSLMSQLLDAAARIVACSRAVLEQTVAAHAAIAPRSSCIYNGVEVPAVPPAPLPQTPHVLCLGRLVPAKGFDVALRAFADVAARMPDARFTVAGDGASRDDLVALTRDLGLETRVAFPGWIEPERVPSLLNEATVVVMPSRREGMPIVAIQAAFMARPIIATNAGGLAEIVSDGESGVVVPSDDSGMLANAIVRLAGDREMASRMGALGRASALAAFPWERNVSAYHAAYESLLQEDGPHVQPL